MYNLDNSSMDKDRIDAQKSDDDASNVNLKDTDRWIKGKFLKRDTKLDYEKQQIILQELSNEYILCFLHYF